METSRPQEVDRCLFLSQQLEVLQARVAKIEQVLHRDARVTRARQKHAAIKELEERVGNTLNRAITVFQINLTIVGYLSLMTDIPCNERHFFSYVCYALAFMSLVSTMTKVMRLIGYNSYFKEFVPGDGDSPIRSFDPQQHRDAEGGVGSGDWPYIGGREESKAQNTQQVNDLSLEEGLLPEDGVAPTDPPRDDAPPGHDVPPGVQVPSKEAAPSTLYYTLGALVQIIMLGLLGTTLSAMFGLYSYDWNCVNNHVPNQKRNHGNGYGIPDRPPRLGYGFAAT